MTRLSKIEEKKKLRGSAVTTKTRILTPLPFETESYKRLRRDAVLVCKGEMTAEEDERFVSDAGYREGMIETVMTNLCIEQGFVPLAWTGEVLCKKCGPMPVEPALSGPVDACPWCHTEVGDAINELKKGPESAFSEEVREKYGLY